MMLLFLIFLAVIFPADCIHVQCGNASDSNAGAHEAPTALYVLGDSLFDSGNNNLLPTLARANFLPYGVDFDTGPTGRFTNGRTVADFVAEFLGLPFAPPYVSMPKGSARRQASGLNFASASCGILPATGKNLGRCLSFAEQIDLLQLTIDLELPKYIETKAKISTHLSSSLFLISIGSNDYLINYVRPLSPTRAFYSPHLFARRLVTSLSAQLQRLYTMGARKMVVFELGPIGCIPSIRKDIRNDGRCAEDVNHFVTVYNDKLRRTLKALESSLPGSTLILGRVFNLAYDAIMNPTTYGLSDSSNACCITWANGTSGCIPGLPPCADPFQYFFWDGFHLTEAAYRIVAKRCIDDSSVCNPRSIKELVN